MNDSIYMIAKNIAFILVFACLLPFNHFGQTCHSIGIRGQKIEIKLSKGYINYTGLAFEFLDPNSTMLEFEMHLNRHLFLATNAYRLKHGLPALQPISIQDSAAENQCKYLIDETQKVNVMILSHEQINISNPYYTGKSFTDRVEFLAKDKKFYGGENLLYSYFDLKDFNEEKLDQCAKKLANRLVFVEWHNSPGHRKNMLNRKYKTIGVYGLIRMKFYRDRFKNCKNELQSYAEGEPWYTVYAAQVFGL